MTRLAQIRVTASTLYDEDNRVPTPFGVLDPRLGLSQKGANCATCAQNLADCPGHYGVIKLRLPVYNIGYVKATISVLQCVCKTCSRILVPVHHRERIVTKMRDPDKDALSKKSELKALVALCKKVKTCPYCGAPNGPVKQVKSKEGIRLVHERPRIVRDSFIADAAEAAARNPDFAQFLERDVDKMLETLTPLEVLRIFRKIPSGDVDLMWSRAENGRPESMIFTHLLVPPKCIRLSVAQDSSGSTNEDELNTQLNRIVEANQSMQVDLTSGGVLTRVAAHWDWLQRVVAEYINGDLPGMPSSMRDEKTKVRGLCQRLKGKQGRFRGNLLGKRVNFSARTVISPDPNLRIEEVGVPVKLARILTYPERVTKFNLKRLREAVRNGPNKWPGAEYVTLQSRPGIVHRLKYDRNEMASKLQVGDLVARHLQHNEVVLFNRQPSLHKMSIMAHRAFVMPNSTFRFNECVCNPYNADFDGDEMNLHLPQTEEARAEAAMLMDVRHNMITPRSGESLVCATQDFLTAIFCLTQRDTFLNYDEFCQVASWLGDAGEHIDMPRPAVYKPVRLWTGKQVVALLLRPSSKDGVLLNMEAKASLASPQLYSDHAMCPNDGWVIIRNSEVMSGVLDKKTMGSAKQGLVYVLNRDHSQREAARCLWRLTKMCTRWFTEFGFSIGLEDVTPTRNLADGRSALVRKAYGECDDLIGDYKAGRLKLSPGCDMAQSLEAEMTSVLNELREQVGSMCVKTLSRMNATKVMSTSGAKGSAVNISQMVACLGQQVVNGKRIPEGFVDRTLPIFPRHAKDPAAKGFVASSFRAGLSATEFFFHTMGGREGLVDTAVKTSETGYMQRRLMKCLEDLTVQYDSTVRTAAGNIVQFVYGDDHLDPACIENDETPVPLKRLLLSAKVQPSKEGERGLLPVEIRECVDEALRPEKIAKLLPVLAAHESPDLEEERAAVFRTAATKLASGGAGSGAGDDVLLSDSEDAADEIEGVAEATRFIAELRAFVYSLASDVAERRSMLRLDPGDGSVTPLDELADQAVRDRLGQEAPRPRAFDEEWIAATRERDSTEDEALRSVSLQNTARLTRSQLDWLLNRALARYDRSVLEAGDAVGALAAHSLGEPATQMTLKTFHFAGIASMNVTLGVPRVKEVINASAKISTPITEAYLEPRLEVEEATARIVKGRIEKTLLGEVCDFIKEVYTSTKCYIAIKLDKQLISKLYLDVTPHGVRESILRTKNIKLKESDVDITKRGLIIVTAPRETSRAAASIAAESSRAVQYFKLQRLKGLLPSVVVRGIPSVSRAVIQELDKKNKYYREEVAGGPHGKKQHFLCIEGYDLLEVMGTPGVDPTRTESNHVKEMETCLGIEAARSKIMSELGRVYSQYGIDIDQRHLMLLADVMTYRGSVLGITRFGIDKMKDSVLMLASFEKTPDHLFDAAVHSRVDKVIGVSECIIMGVPIPLGTGLFKLLRQPQQVKPASRRRPLLTSSLGRLGTSGPGVSARLDAAM